jgi:hypothetical protein
MEKDSDYIPRGCYLAPLTLFEFLVVLFGGPMLQLHYTTHSALPGSPRLGKEGICSDRVAFRGALLLISCSSPAKKSRDLFLASKWDKEEGVPYILARPSSACIEGFVGERISYYASLIYKGSFTFT